MERFRLGVDGPRRYVVPICLRYMDKPFEPARSRTPAGAAVLRTDVTDAIVAAAREELAEAGFGRFSMDVVAKRAGVGKAALYRRWRSRQALIASLVQDIGIGVEASPDTGSLEGDLKAFFEASSKALADPFATRVLPELHCEMARDPELQKTVLDSIQKPRRANGVAILRRAQQRRELPADLDEDFALEVLGASLYWRLTVIRKPASPKYLRRLVAATLAALKASAV
ncbi:TetR/AcrR family transcriptional regulator [Cupriavidus sp. UYPR2.512]|uniref:TetR/AcrR family transcriptional regulator n=1 Tax=Cupriavidus sp. UYPR2.512 TaxID=1080187 RepID=UPI0018DF77DA|nr:TetR/AcrR family transcriptional regulator [Cupriavidus sp. UYPR2.512]UIF84727.1 TetR/AcrR family transcriptional regulator [Cupriavidus necator]